MSEKTRGKAVHVIGKAKKLLFNRRGSGIVEYVGLAAVVLVVIVVIILPGMKTLFNVDIFPGLTDKITSIFSFS